MSVRNRCNGLLSFNQEKHMTFPAVEYVKNTKYYKFEIAGSSDIYYCSDLELFDLDNFNCIVDIEYETEFSWKDIKTITGIKNFIDFENSSYRSWKKSWILKDDCLGGKKIVHLTSNISLNSNIKTLDAWMQDYSSEKKFFISDGVIFCKESSGLQGNGDIGVLLCYFKDILSPELINSKEDDAKYAYFIVDDDFSAIRKAYILEQIEKNMQQEVGGLTAIFTAIEMGMPFEKWANSLNKINPSYYNKIVEGYKIEELVFFDRLLQKIDSSKVLQHVTYCEKTKKYSLLINISTASRILSKYLNKKYTPSKLRKLYHEKLLDGIKINQIMIYVSSILGFIQQKSDDRNISIFSIYCNLFNK